MTVRLTVQRRDKLSRLNCGVLSCIYIYIYIYIFRIAVKHEKRTGVRLWRSASCKNGDFNRRNSSALYVVNFARYVFSVVRETIKPLGRSTAEKLLDVLEPSSMEG